MTGPYETQEQASQAAAGIYAAMRADTAGGAMTRGGRDLVEGACQRAGVTLGAYDRRIVEWLAGIAPEYAAVIAGLAERAAALTEAQLAVLRRLYSDARDFRTEGVGGACKDCDASPEQVCADHQADLDLFDSYRQLAGQLGVPQEEL